MSELSTQWIVPEDVPGLLRPGMRVYVQGVTGEPLTLVEALKARPAASDGVTYSGVFLPGVNTTDYAGLAAGARSTLHFGTSESQSSMDAGKARFVPTYYSRYFRDLESGPAPDLALVQVSEPNDAGRCSLGVAPDFLPALLSHDGLTLVAEVNAQMPWCPDSPTIALDRIDYAVRADHPLPEQSAAAVEEPLSTITRLAAEHIPDGACIQIGVGRLPSAIAGALGDKNDLGVHSGMIADSVLDLLDKGVVTGRRKPRDTGKVVTGIALGTQSFYRRVADRPDVAFRPVSYTHDVRVAADMDRFTAINSVVEVDLYGQVNAESVAGRQISAAGGLPDFVRAAAMSPDGRAIYALAATAGRGTISRIVPRIGDGVVTCSRTDTDWIVTEYGAASLRGLDVEARAQAVIGLAAPKFRDGLRDAWKEIRRHER